MPTIIFEITSTENKVLRTDMVDVSLWAQNALQNKARKLIHRLITDHTHFNPNKLTPKEIDDLISSMTLVPVLLEPVEPVIPP